MTRQLGLSLLQNLLLMAIGLMLLVYLGIFFADVQETRDAEVVEAVQVSLQSSVSRGMTALQLPPSKIHPANILNDARTNWPKGVSVDQHFHMVINRSGREAQFAITPKGDLEVAGLKNFTRFRVQKGRIVRNNHWLPSAPLLAPIAEPNAEAPENDG